MEDKIERSEDEWKRRLTPEQYRVLREKGTEAAFTGKYWDVDADGMFRCAGCGAALFASDAKFDSGTGWPSFSSPAAKDAVALRPDDSLGVPRTEVVCAKCGGHLGHVFDDGPGPEGKRFCINSCSLSLDEKKKE